MPQDILRTNANLGNIIYEWTVKEYEKYFRSPRWYLIAGVLAFFLLLYAIFSSNYLFALIIVLISIIVFLHDVQEPQDIPFAITEAGLVLGRKFYPYTELKDFWIIYDPPVTKQMYFRLDNLVKHQISVPLMEYDPLAIREELLKFIDEDLEQTEENLSERLAKTFKIG